MPRANIVDSITESRVVRGPHCSRNTPCNHDNKADLIDAWCDDGNSGSNLNFLNRRLEFMNWNWLFVGECQRASTLFGALYSGHVWTLAQRTTQNSNGAPINPIWIRARKVTTAQAQAFTTGRVEVEHTTGRDTRKAENRLKIRFFKVTFNSTDHATCEEFTKSAICLRILTNHVKSSSTKHTLIPR